MEVVHTVSQVVVWITCMIYLLLVWEVMKMTGGVDEGRRGATIAAEDADTCEVRWLLYRQTAQIFKVVLSFLLVGL